jgi:hypothetical protein
MTGTLIGIWLLCGLIAIGVGREKGRNLADSFMFGAVLGPLGVLLVAILKPPVNR